MPLSRRSLLQLGVTAAAGLMSRRASSSTGTSLQEDEPWRMSAGDLARAIREKQLSSREVITSHLERIEAVNGEINAITDVLADQALAAADEADRTLAGSSDVGMLHGVPMTVKENIDLAGSPTTQGVPALAQAIPPIDAPRIAQLRKQGAIAIGRTNLPDFALRWHTDSSLRGPTLNPWDRDRTPGGSSGGDAVALATGMTPLGNGNDYGGSLRWPAQCCGIASIRPSRGRVPHASAVAPGDPPITIQMMAVEGPMARRVADVRLALSAMSGHDARDPWYVPVPLAGPTVAKPIKVAVAVNPGGEGIHPDVVDGVHKAARVLEEAGYAVEEVDPPAVEEASMLWMKLIVADIRVALWPPVTAIVGEDANTFIDFLLSRVPEIGIQEYVAGLAELNGLARQYSQFFERYPLILGPVSTEPPFTVGKDLASADDAWEIFRSMRLVVTANLLGLPAAAVPVGVANGLPQGVQVMGSMFREDLCLDATQVIEDAIEEALGVLTPIVPKT